MENSSMFAVFSNNTGKRLKSGLKGTELEKFLKADWRKQGRVRQEYTVIETHRPVVKALGRFKTKHIVVCSNGEVKWGKRIFFHSN